MTSPTPSEPFTGQQLYHGAPLRPWPAAGLTLLAVVTLYVVQIVLVSFRTLDLVASAISDVAVVAVVVAFARKRGLTLRDLGVRSAPGRFYAAALLLGISMWYVTALIVVLVNPPGDTEKLQELVAQTPFVPTLIALTVFPAVAEELVFRGVLARSLAGWFRPLVAIAISAASFGLYHVFPPQVVSTFVLGFALGLLAVKSRSILPAMIVHVLNNAIAIVLARDTIPGLGSWMTDNAGVTLGIALVLAASGIALSAKGVAA